MDLPNAAFHPGFGGGQQQAADSAAPEGEVAWYLSGEVFRSLDQIVASVDDCLESLPRPVRSDCPAPQERFVMQQSAGQGGGADTARCVLVMEGPALVQAELQVKIHKHPNTIHKTSILPDAPWLLVQLQDAANMLAEARRCADSAGRQRTQVEARRREGTLDAGFLRCLTARLSHRIEELMLRLRRGRDCAHHAAKTHHPGPP
ncbi:Protein rogdi [Amphibalanus amphitrite]|uniref:Protein rogdi n=1 Tax=Amphibalanus amphitrite TaxID=1232801 RepID=A0A6A4VL76_AMPAM|nr:Protein rogdi [Amphibalanus amphitrite]